MLKKLKALKKEIFYIRKTLAIGQAPIYFVNKYFIANKIKKAKTVFEKEITNNELSIHLLTCHRDITMLLWSLFSFYKNSKVVGKLFIHNDGSLIKKDKELIRKFFPSATIIEPDYLVKEFSSELDKYPIIKKFRIEYTKYNLLKKLIDPYFVSDKKYLLILDSDIIWFKNPKEIEDELASGGNRSHMMRGQRKCCVEFKGGKIMEDRLAYFNSGVVIFNRENLNFKKLTEFFNSVDETKENYFIDQAGYAYGLDNLYPLSEKLYSLKEKVDNDTVMFHYTGPLRYKFYTEGVELLRVFLAI